jgi:hypothetical protein
MLVNKLRFKKKRNRRLAVEEDPSVGNDVGTLVAGLHKHDSVGRYVHKGELTVVVCGTGGVCRLEHLHSFLCCIWAGA